jgi:hypothetical protein
LCPALAACVVVISFGCGKKGPPLPPLVKLPVAPADLSAERRGDDVTIQFIVPASNTDNSKPANVERVDVYALTGASTTPDDELVKHGTKVGSVAVKAPRDPDATVDEDESTDEVEAPQGKGLDQGAVARVDDRLTATARIASDVQARPSHREKNAAGPLIGPPTLVATRVYVGVGVSTRGRRGTFSKRVAVPLVDAPPAPSSPTIVYDESTITVTWSGPDAPGPDAPLPAYPLGIPPPTYAYNVYEVASATGGSEPAAGSGETRLTKSPVADLTYADTRMDWDATRCYAVRAIESLGDLKIESLDSGPACVTLADKFPPAAPKGLQAVGSEGAISLIWESNGEKDLAGYLVLRGMSAGDLAPITGAPIADTNFKDTVPSGVRYTYAIVAVDKAGNKSAPSGTVDETARD